MADDREKRGSKTLVPIAAFDYEHQANLAVSFLASVGIKAVIAADDCGRTDPVLGVVTGGVRVMVQEWQAAEAARALGSSQGNDVAPNNSLQRTP